MAKTYTLGSLVRHGGRVYKAGTRLELDDETAAKYRAKGVLHEGKGPSRVERAQEKLGIRRGGARMQEEPQERLVFLPVSPQQYQALTEAGYGSPDAVRAASDEELLAIDGIGEGAVKQLRAALGK